MSRRSTPDRIDVARRMAVRNRLAGEGMSEQLAERWVAAWEAERPTPVTERMPDYWRDGTAWIYKQRRERATPA